MIFNSTLNYGANLLKDSRIGYGRDAHWDWKDPQDLHPANTIISPETYVHLTGWSYKMLEFPIMKPLDGFHNIVKQSKKYWLQNYNAFKKIYNMVGYTYYDTLWMSLKSTKTEEEQMIWLNKQPFLQDTPDCQEHGGNFSSWV